MNIRELEAESDRLRDAITELQRQKIAVDGQLEIHGYHRPSMLSDRKDDLNWYWIGALHKINAVAEMKRVEKLLFNLALSDVRKVYEHLALFERNFRKVRELRVALDAFMKMHQTNHEWPSKGHSDGEEAKDKSPVSDAGGGPEPVLSDPAAVHDARCA